MARTGRRVLGVCAPIEGGSARGHERIIVAVLQRGTEHVVIVDRKWQNGLGSSMRSRSPDLSCAASIDYRVAPRQVAAHVT